MLCHPMHTHLKYTLVMAILALYGCAPAPALPWRKTALDNAKAEERMSASQCVVIVFYTNKTPPELKTKTVHGPERSSAAG